MKNIIGALLLACWLPLVGTAQQYEHTYQGETRPLDLNTEYAYLVMDGMASSVELSRRFGNVEVTHMGKYNPGKTLTGVAGSKALQREAQWAEVRFSQKMSEDDYWSWLKSAESRSDVVVAAPYFSSPKAPGEKIGLSNLFMVKVMAPEGEDFIYALAEDNRVEVIGRNRFMPNWFTLAVTKESAGNALEMSQVFSESGYFAASEPSFMFESLTECVNDPLFPDQWGHENTAANVGTPGIDIKACDAWSNWGTGSASVTVAVLDHGFEQNHPDLAGNNVGTGYDTGSGSSPALVLGSHGTACAGIVGALRNNNQGVSGVAPNVGLMSISNALNLYPGVQQDLADGLNWAWQNGADVISNSWGHALLQSVLIDDAITNALTNGRGGLGTVVCFAAGNSNNAVIYPANSNPDILAVGAMSPCGERKSPASCDGFSWGSCFGPELDVMAPGVFIPTTDRQGPVGYDPGDYTLTFSGTSSACPHVAGLAGLLIDLNPCLTAKQVSDIIERTAQKVGGYAYSGTAGRPNGEWHTEMGYGLINLDAAMQMVRELYLQNETVTDTRTYQVHGTIAAGSNVDPSQAPGPFIVDNGADVTFAASQGITLAAGFSTNLGAAFTAGIISTNCAAWDPNARKPQPEPLAAVEEAWDRPVQEEVAVLGSPLHWSISPNPFHDQLIIQYSLESRGTVEAGLYSIHGQKVAEILPRSSHEAGQFRQRRTLPGALPNGVYILRMEVDGVPSNKKLIKH